MSFVLKIEKQRRGAVSEHFRFEGHGKRIFRLGRLRSCHVPLEDAQASKLQAVIVMDGSAGSLENVSTTSFAVNGHTLGPGRKVVLGDATVLEVGDTRLDVRIRPGGGESTLAKLQALISAHRPQRAEPLTQVAYPVDASTHAEPRPLSWDRRLSLQEAFDDLQLPEGHPFDATGGVSDETRRMLATLQREQRVRRLGVGLVLLAVIAIGVGIAQHTSPPMPSGGGAPVHAAPDGNPAPR